MSRGTARTASNATRRLDLQHAADLDEEVDNAEAAFWDELTSSSAISSDCDCGEEEDAVEDEDAILEQADEARKQSNDSGIAVDNGRESGDSGTPVEVRLSRNVEQIEELLRRINDENRKTKEVLATINRATTDNFKETTTSIVLSKGSYISLSAKKTDANGNGSDAAAKKRKKKKRKRSKSKTRSARDGDDGNADDDDNDDDDGGNSEDESGASSGSTSTSSGPRTEDLLFYETSAEGKKTPLIHFHFQALSHPERYVMGTKFRMAFKTVSADARLVGQICYAHGLHEVHSSNSDYNLAWTGSHPKPHAFKAMLPHQRVNHFPRSYELTRKDRLYQNIERLQHARGAKNFNFVPKTFLIPQEYSEFAATHHRMRGAWIVKPVASSRGRGIFIVSHPSQVPLDEPMVVGKYIDNPLLVNGHKWDLRLYVAVTSYDPLLIYLYEEGLVRFATVKYDASGKNLWNPCMHLCNYSINKYHSDYVKSDDADAEDQGHKWTLSALLRHLKAHGIDTHGLMQAIEDVIIKSIVSVEFAVNSACKMFVPHKRNCFELYGYDILIDSDLKPWLLEVNLSPSINCEAPIDMKVKSAMLCDLFNLIGVPGVDPVLKRAQFNKKINEMTAAANAAAAASSASSATSARSSKISVETRRFAAIRLAATATPYSQELARMVRNIREEFSRRGGWVRIFPTADTWQNYGALLEYSSPNNLILHEQLYPNATRKALRINSRRNNNSFGNASGAGNGAVNNKAVDFTRKRSRSLGTSRLERDKSLTDLSRTKKHSPVPIACDEDAPCDPIVSLSGAVRAATSAANLIASASAASLAPSGSPEDDAVAPPTPEPASATPAILKPSPSEMRMAQYEKSLVKGHKPRSALVKKDPEKLEKGRTEKKQRSNVLKDKIVKMIESGLQLSEYQARKAFSVYLHCLLQRLSDFDNDPTAAAASSTPSGGDTAQIDLVMKFLQKAALSLREPYFLKAPSSKLSGKDKAAIVAKELNEFLAHYRRETEVFTVFREEPGMVQRHVFEEFIAFASDTDLEDVLTLQTKLYRCAHIFLGKCLPPATGRKNSLLRTAYGISPDRNLRDRQCSMRMNARANPPTAPQFAPPPAPPARCLDISTVEKSKLEELEEDAFEPTPPVHRSMASAANQVIRIGVMVKKMEPPCTSATRMKREALVARRELAVMPKVDLQLDDAAAATTANANAATATANMPRVSSAPSNLS